MSEWIEYELGELLSYEQPTPFIVESTDYDDSYPIPVLTAGKSFLLGYTNEKKGIYDAVPVIIFDDFTTASQYVNFKFKVKSSAMKILTANKKLVLPKFIFYRMQIIDFDASTHKRYWIQHYSKIKVAIPSLPEQERIVAKIEELFSQLEDGITSLAKTKKLLRIHKQAILDKCFSGYAEKHKLKELCAFITKGTTPPKDTFIKTDGIPFIKVYNLTFNTELDFTIEPTFITAATHNNDLSRSIVYPGDVLMNIVGPPLGKVSIVPNEYKEWNINQAIARFRCRDGLYNKYLAYYLLSHRTIEALKEKSKATAGQVNLTLEICRELEIPLIPLNEQRKMVCDIETKLSNIIQIEKTVDATLLQAEALRQSILKKAFNGEL